MNWKRLLLETDAFGNGWIGKWSFGKGCSWKRMNWKRVLLEKGAFGNGCFWKWVLLEMDELENGLLEKVLFEKNALEKKERMGELKSSKK